MANKKCPIPRAVFESEAEPFHVEIFKQYINLKPKKFKSGAFGWHAPAKIQVKVAGIKAEAQVQVCITLVGSKDLQRNPLEE